MADIAYPSNHRPGSSGRWETARTKSRRLGDLTIEALKSPTTLAGAIIIVLLIGMAILAPLLTEPNMPDPYQMTRDWAKINAPPGTPGHLLGTTPEGGDVLYGVLWGARTSLRLAFIVVGATMAIGVTVGSVAGFMGGKWDDFLMRVVDVVLAVPDLIMALAIAAALGPSFQNIILAMVALSWPRYARIIRGQILHVKQNEYIDVAELMGESRWRIYCKDILPNSITPVAVQATLEMGRVVLFGATLSFIGLAEAGLAEWGNLVSEGQQGIITGRWWVATFGGAMVFLWSLGFNLFGDGLRDILDPRTEGR